MTPRFARALFLITALICLGVAFLLTAGLVFHGSNASAWGYAGLTALAAAFLVEHLA